MQASIPRRAPALLLCIALLSTVVLPVAAQSAYPFHEELVERTGDWAWASTLVVPESTECMLWLEAEGGAFDSRYTIRPADDLSAHYWGGGYSLRSQFSSETDAGYWMGSEHVPLTPTFGLYHPQNPVKTRFWTPLDAGEYVMTFGVEKEADGLGRPIDSRLWIECEDPVEFGFLAWGTYRNIRLSEFSAAAGVHASNEPVETFAVDAASLTLELAGESWMGYGIGGVPQTASVRVGLHDPSGHREETFGLDATGGTTQYVSFFERYSGNVTLVAELDGHAYEAVLRLHTEEFPLGTFD